MKNGFDNDKYLKIQSEHIKERISKFGDKLYLEFGGKSGKETILRLKSSEWPPKTINQ